MERFYVDRIENDIAVCENDRGDFINIKVNELPNGIKEGTVLIRYDVDKFYIDNKQEMKRRKYLFDLQKQLNE